MKNGLKKLMSWVLLDLLKKTDYDNKITEMEGKIPSSSALATTAVINVTDNEIANVGI